MARVLLRWLVVGLFVGMGIGAVSGLTISRLIKLPAVEALTTFRPLAATEVRARNGSLVDTFFTERRIPLPEDQIPEVFRQAIVAVEDAGFFRHPGFDLRGIARAGLRNLVSRRRGEGGSTITQQLARSLFLTPERTYGRKLREALLAIQIEQTFSKDQILTLYANQVPMGHGTYGVESASRYYFGKAARDMSIAEAALLAGIVQRPAALSPLVNPQRALNRRNHVLNRMRDLRFIDDEEWAAAREEPIVASVHLDRNPKAAYFIEATRRAVEDRFGTDQLLRGGLQVETTLDPVLQEYAELSVREGLVALQRRLGYARASRNLVQEGVSDLGTWRHPAWRFLRWEEGELVNGVVQDVRAQDATVLIGGRTATLTREGIEWTGRNNLTRLMEPGDVALVRLAKVPDSFEEPVTVTLESEPRVEGAMVVLDNRTGAILAMVGGFSFDRSQFDRAVQAKRQCGSAFKPFVFLSALEQGFTPADTVFDGPVLLPDEHGELTYCPMNYYRNFDGIVTLRHAAEMSLNIPTVKLQQMVGGRAVIDVARRLGIRERLAPYSSLALGSFEVNLLDLTAAYAAIANRGYRAQPYFISRVVNPEGQVLLENRPQVQQAVREDVAYLMTSILEGAVHRGTGQRAARLPGRLAGKTGTTNQFTDAWFVGYSPRISVGVWVGRDLKRPIGRGMTGAEAALPTWIAFMERYLAEQSEAVQREEFPVPAGITFVTVDRRTGLRAGPQCGDSVILEAFPGGREPQDCSAHQHVLLRLPWQQQLPHYEWKPGEPPTTPESVAAATDRGWEGELPDGFEMELPLAEELTVGDLPPQP